MPLPCFHAPMASFHPRWDGNGADMSGLAQKVGDDPVLVAVLDGFAVQAEKLTATESVSDQHGEDGVLPLAAERIAVRAGQKPSALLGCDPVPNADTNLAHSFNPSDPSGELGTEQAGIGGFVRDSSHGGQAQVDRCWRVLLLFEIDSVSQDHRPIERKARLGAEPVNEIRDGAVIGSLTAPGRKTVQDCRFCLFKVGKGQDSFGCRFLLRVFGIGRRPP